MRGEPEWLLVFRDRIERWSARVVERNLSRLCLQIMPGAPVRTACGSRRLITDRESRVWKTSTARYRRRFWRLTTIAHSPTIPSSRSSMSDKLQFVAIA